VRQPGTIHGHFAELAFDARVGTWVPVLKLKLPAAVLTTARRPIEILLAVGLDAILLYIGRGAVRAVNRSGGPV
jgi:hypothetical protein